MTGGSKRGGRLTGLLAAAGLGVGLAALGGSPVATPPPAAAADLNHAAIVIDTGDGEVRRYCLAFPEPAISGAEALRRIDVDPVFSSYGAKGEAVCSLCGVGCPAGDCFCNARYWSYHRAGPGGEAYTTSRVGASSTEVRNGDVEGWRWGGGQAPPPATVGQVCDVPEPASRTAANASTTTTAAPPRSTTTAPAPAGAPAPTSSTIPPGAPAPAGPAAPRSAVPAPAAVPGPRPAEVAGDTQTSTVEPQDDPDAGVLEHGGGDPGRSSEDPATAAPAANTREPAGSAGDGGPGGILGIAAFVAVLGGVLGWRARLRRADVRP